MFFEAARLTNSTKELAEMLDKWDIELTKYEEIKEEKAAKGQDYKAMEIQLLKANRRFAAILDYMQAAHSYTKALEEKLTEAEETKNELRKLKKHVQRVEAIIRMPIEEMR